MSSADTVRALLRDVKGIFDVAGVYFLVSVSDEAARDLSLGALGQRNEFNSSFYTVLRVPTLEPDGGETLILKRRESFDRGAARALSVLAGGLPRELVRMSDVVARTDHFRDWPAVDRAVAIVMGVEVREFTDEVVSGSWLPNDDQASSFIVNSTQSDLLKLAVFESTTGLADQASPRAFCSESLARISRDWTPTWATVDPSGVLTQRWRCLLIRLYVAGRLVQLKGDGTRLGSMRALQEVVHVAPSSPRVAHAILTNQFTDLGSIVERGSFWRGSHPTD